MMRARSPSGPEAPCSWSIKCSARDVAEYSTRSKSNASSTGPAPTTSEKLSVSSACFVQAPCLFRVTGAGLEQRVLGELLGYVRLKLQVAELEQLDRLRQLGCQNQLL